jgi:hypothetical protein
MEKIDLTKIKYYPDRFYIRLDGFDIDNLTTFITDLNIGQQQSIFIHEYYHYLTNISTFPGIRQFHLNFCDRFSIITKLNVVGLKAYPICNNKFPNCEDLVDDWNTVSEIIKDDDIDYELIKETQNTQNKRFDITFIETVLKRMDIKENGNLIKGDRELIKISIKGLVNINSFNLTFGAIDEFLSSSIDEYLYENDLADINASELSQRPFYPYGFLDKLLSFYSIQRPSAFEKILISYFALNSFNPPVKMIHILEQLKKGDYALFQNSPEEYLINNFSEIPQYENVLNGIQNFANLTGNQGRIHISQALKYYYDKFYIAQKLKEKDFFYFIRPFFVTEPNTQKGKQKFLLELSRIINVFSPPIILKQGVFSSVDKLTTFGESTLLILATYEIFESLNKDSFAKRPDYLKRKYSYPDQDQECDNWKNFTPPPITNVFQLALNEISLFKLYLDELEKTKNTE